MKPNYLLLLGLILLGFCSTYSDKDYRLAEYGCKIWKPKHWDDQHYECFDSKGQRAIYKLDKGQLIHIPRLDDIVYDWKWKILNDKHVIEISLT